MIGLDEDQRVREQVVAHVRVAAQDPRVARLAREILDRSLREDVAKVRPERIDEPDVVEEQRIDRILVDRAQVIRLEEHVDRELPGQSALLAARRVVRRARQAEAGQVLDDLRAEPGRRVERLARRRPDEDQPGGDIARHAREPAALSLDRREAALVRDPEQRAIAAVTPRVVGAHERLLALATHGWLDSRAAVAAHVQERADLAGVVACDQERDAARDVGEEVSRFRDLRDVTAEDGKLAKQRGQLARITGVAIGAGVVRGDRQQRRAILGIGGAALAVREHALDQLMMQLWLHAAPLTRVRRFAAAGAAATPGSPVSTIRRASEMTSRSYAAEICFARGGPTIRSTVVHAATK